MARYPDLSPHTDSPGSLPDGVVALNVGWLEAGETFLQGDVQPEFLEALGQLCRDGPQMRMRGWHRCQLDHTDGQSTSPYPVVAYVGGRRFSLGGAEVRVIDADGNWLIAPDLVLHYVTAHGYLPPEPFIEAVTARRAAPPDTSA
ncbi:MAG TPA: hypothetical protein VGO89_21430 [Streptomyces sp.]|nr:hypothetical protein [Streptomyces sp.]